MRIKAVEICSYVISTTVPMLLKRWKALEYGLEVSSETFKALSKRFKSRTIKWFQEEREAQDKRQMDPKAMDIYDTTMAKGMGS
jgi:hypothetical protein